MDAHRGAGGAAGGEAVRRLLLAFAAVTVLAAGWRIARACATEYVTAVFSYTRHPDFPRSAFLDGRLGVLQPTFARSYLVIAYRQLTGIGMSPGEREQTRDYYKDRGTRDWDRSGTDWPERWRAVRKRIPVPPPPKTLLITDGQMAYDRETRSFFLNCAEDAFRTALHTLEARRGRFGASSAAFRSWLGAQDAVFANCDGTKPSIPEPAPPALPALIRADRDYQIAAARFYAREYPAAVEGFRRISRDPSSPWNTISRYLVVRTLLRMTDDRGTAVQAGSQINAEAAAILADPRLQRIHSMTWNLATRESIRERDPEFFRSLARLLSNRGQDNGFREALWNYTDMYDGVIGDADPNAIFPPEKPPAPDPAPFRDVDLSDWIYCFQSKGQSELAHSLARWSRTRSTAWLLAAIAHADAAAARKSGLVEAAEALPEASPAYLTARFHLFRIYEEEGDRATARDGIGAVLAGAAVRNLPSSANLFRGLGMLAAPTFREFLQFAARPPVLITYSLDVGEKPGFWENERLRSTWSGARLDRDATRVLNRGIPYRLVKETAASGALPENLRPEVLLTAFTRGLMLGEDLTELAKDLPLAAPYLEERTPEGRQFAAALILLRHPGARPYFGSGISRETRPGRIDNYRDNWWCPMDVVGALDTRASQYGWASPNLLQRSTDPIAPAFLTVDDTAEAAREFQKLAALGPATDFLGGIVLDYAGVHPDDPRVPEALHYVVRSARFGCSDTDTWKTTRAAFRLLHTRYPKSQWARRTPTWFRQD
jgi:hypothetical protein